MDKHAHEWKPVEGMMGAYTCEGCTAFGERNIVDGKIYSTSEKPKKKDNSMFSAMPKKRAPRQDKYGTIETESGGNHRWPYRWKNKL